MENKTTLVILAAGMGSRYGAGIKQLEGVGPCGEIILEYSIFDAIRAGFDEVVFVIRKELRDAFDKIICDDIKKQIKVSYCYQELTDVPDGFAAPEGRKKPWGTGHAVRAARNIVDGPFAVINADDYYGRHSFKVLHDHLAALDVSEKPMDFCMVGFLMGNTLSDNGTVKRGYCKVSDDAKLVSIEEMYDLRREDGVIKGHNEAGTEYEFKSDDMVSMSMWGFVPGFFDVLEEKMTGFFESSADLEKQELNLPTNVDEAVTEGKAVVNVLSSPDSWFGVTYQADRAKVVDELKKLHDAGKYPTPLFGNNN